MSRKKHHLNSSCKCSHKKHHCRLIVLTGGPGAGKTAVLESIKTIICHHVAILPEAASIIFGGGFWRLKSISARMAAQRGIFHVQREMEKLVSFEKKWGIGLCDRGTLDGLAYWPKNEELFWKSFNTNKKSELQRYHAIIHLRTPTVDMGYNHQNPMRIETPEEAVLIDEKIHQIWHDHPNYYTIESTNSFLDKVDKAFTVIKNLIPDCCKNHHE